MSGATNNVFGHHPKLLIINGAVGAGKSSVIKELSKRIKCLVIPEYIDEPDGVERLNEYLNDKEHKAFIFQDYILNHYIWYIHRESFLDRLSDVDYVIMERNPIEGIKTFARMDFINGFINDEEYKQLELKSILTLDNIRKVIGCNHPVNHQVYVDTSSKNIEEVVDQIINEKLLDKEQLALIAKPEILYERIHKRNRPGETEAYDMKFIKYLSSIYEH